MRWVISGKYLRRGGPRQARPGKARRRRGNWYVGLDTSNGAEGIRTLDPLDANQVLSQLSYRPEAPGIWYDAPFRSKPERRIV
jgi:hypothetical protein